MAELVSASVRRLVRDRAGDRCEYCLMPAWALLAGCEVDHVISRKHGGISDPANLAWSCARCNRAKGTDVGSIMENTNVFTRLFNPRIDRWSDHFEVQEGRVLGLTEVGSVTAQLLRFNDDDRVEERRLLMRLRDRGGEGRDQLPVGAP